MDVDDFEFVDFEPHSGDQVLLNDSDQIILRSVFGMFMCLHTINNAVLFALGSHLFDHEAITRDQMQKLILAKDKLSPAALAFKNTDDNLARVECSNIGSQMKLTKFTLCRHCFDVFGPGGQAR